jgi:type IV pilus assembly protein PilO
MAVNFNALVEEIKRTNWQDPGTWHAAPKSLVLIAILIAIPIAGFFADTKGQIDELEGLITAEGKLKDDYLAKKKVAVNLDLHRQQLREIDTQFGALLRQLPDKSQMDALLVDINQAGLGRGLQFELFKPAAADIQKDFYAELPIQVKVIGTYHDMGAFAGDVGQLSRIVTLNDVSIIAGRDGNLSMDATARTFRYLNDDEVQNQRRAAAKKAPAPAKAAAPAGRGG